MLEFSCTPRSLRAVDESQGEVLAVGFYRDIRPFRGLLGQLDDRMLGRMSRLAAKGFMQGDLGEITLVPGRPRIPFDKVLAVGLGPMAAFDDAAFSSALAAISRSLTGLRARRCVIELPGRANERITPEHALALLLRDPNGELPFDSVTFVEDPEGERRMRDRAAEERRRTRMR